VWEGGSGGIPPAGESKTARRAACQEQKIAAIFCLLALRFLTLDAGVVYDALRPLLAWVCPGLV